MSILSQKYGKWYSSLSFIHINCKDDAILCKRKMLNPWKICHMYEIEYSCDYLDWIKQTRKYAKTELSKQLIQLEKLALYFVFSFSPFWKHLFKTKWKSKQNNPPTNTNSPDLNFIWNFNGTQAYIKTLLKVKNDFKELHLYAEQ